MAFIWLLFLTAMFVEDSLGRRSAPSIDVRIVGGNATTIEDYPHQVSVMYMDSHACGGSIIGPLFVLTAAHCTDQISANSLSVRAGSTIVDEGGQVIRVESIYQHSQFDNETYDYDISILKLNQALTLGDGVAVVPLAAAANDVPGGIVGIATGWGRLWENGPLPMELQKVDLPTIASDICRLIYGDGLTERMFCAGYVTGQKDACQGDSGGPFVADGILLGITSWGDGCGEANSPGVFTKVSYFRDYIDPIINAL